MRTRLPDTGTTIFAVMSRLANEAGAINLSQGFPNYSSDSRLFDLVRKYMGDGMNQYAPLDGVESLRAAVAGKIKRLYDRTIDINAEVCITAGATQAVYTAIQALIHPGEEAIQFDPSFDIYAPAVKMAGGIIKRIPLWYPDFRIDWDLVEGTITDKTKLIIINYPTNPTGSVCRPEDMLELQRIAEKYDLFVLSDEVYEHLVLNGGRHYSILEYEGLYDRCVATYSFGKTFHNTGWKVGYAIAPPRIMEEFKRIHQFIVFAVNTPVQYALADYMQDEQTYLSLPDFYREKRDYFLKLLESSRFRFIPAEGTYFQLLDYSAISQKTDLEFARELATEHGVASIPLRPFYEYDDEQRLLRFCFAKTNDILESAAERLCRI